MDIKNPSTSPINTSSGTSNGSFTAGTSETNVTNLTATITVKENKRVWVGVEPSGNNSDSFLGITIPSAGTYYAILLIYRGSTLIFRTNAGGTLPAGLTRYPLGFGKWDFPPAGTHTYRVAMFCSPAATNARIDSSKLTVMEG